MKIAGLDLSTSVAGYAILRSKDEIELSGYYSFDKPEGWDYYDLVDQFDEHIWPKIKDADKIILEEALKSYGGMTSNTSVVKLLQFNSIITHRLQRKLGRDKIEKIHPSTAKSNSFLGRGRVPKTYSKPDGAKKSTSRGKYWVLEKTSEHFDIEWPKTSFGNIKNECEDEADAIVLASSYF